MDNKDKKTFRSASAKTNGFWHDSDHDARRPSLYKVFLKREDYATSELTFFVLTRIFHKTPADANNDLAALAKIGRVFCGLYTKEVAETKVLIAKEHAFTNGYPIEFIMQKGRQNVIEES